MKKDRKIYDIGIVLSGGGARGFAHAGVLQALNEFGIFPQVISGVSAGAIVGAFYADGYTPKEIRNFFTEKGMFNYFKFVYPKQGLLKMSGLARVMNKYLSAQTFEELKIPLYVCATNLNTGKRVYFSKGKLHKTIIASSSIPILFNPVKIDGEKYVDGGLLDNLPIRPIRSKCKLLIGVHVNPTGEDVELGNIINIAERAFQLSVGSSIINKARRCDIFIEPKGLDKYRTLGINKGKEIFEKGYKETKKLLNNKAILEKLNISK